MALKLLKLTVRRKRRAFQQKKKKIISVAYKRGRTDGFSRGRADGFEQGKQNAVAIVAPPVIADVETHPPITLDALVIAPGKIASLEIGIIQPFNELKNQGAFHYEVKNENEVTRELIASAKTIVFLRNVEPDAYRFLEWAKEMGKRTVYVIDDNFLTIPPTTPIGLYYNDPARQETFKKFLTDAQIVKVDAPFFGEYIRSRFNENVVYFPASVDFAWMEQVKKPEREDGRIIIGYAGGYKEEAFAPVVPALLKILDYYGDFVKLEFFGFIPSRLIGHPGISYLEGGKDYKTYIHKLHQCTWDIGLAPLEDSLFNECKSNNKFRDYSSCMIAGIYSALPAYRDWVIHGETGYTMIRHSEDSWFAGLRQMIEDPALRRRIKQKAGELAREHFAVEDCAEKWKTLILA